MTYVDPLIGIARASALVDRSAGQFANRRSGARLAQGDYRGAAQAQFGAGEIGAGLELQAAGMANEEAAAAKTEAEQIAFTRQAVRALRESQDPLTEFDRLAPAFRQMGTDDAQIGQLRQGLQAGGREFLDSIEQIAETEARKLEFQKAGDNLYVFEEGNPNPVNTFLPAPEDYTLGDARFSGRTNQPVAMAPREAEYIQRDPTKELIEIPGAPAAGRSEFDGSFESAVGPLLQREGGFVARDGRSGAPANFGINQRANPDVDVRNLTPERAAEIYRTRYWQPVANAGVPPEAREAVFDFAVNAGPGRALQFWEQSGGDIERFNELRLAHYRRQPDYEQNRASWERRVAETTPGGGSGPRVLAAAQAPQETPAQAAASASRLFTQERQLRSEFGNNPAVKTLATVRPQVRIIGDIAQRAAAGERITAQDDLALIFSYMKMLDPGSVVREGEFANAQNTAGIPERVVNAYNNAIRGTRLSDQQRANFFQSATGVMRGYQTEYETAVGRSRGLAESYGLEPDRIAPAPAQRADRQARRRQMPFQPTAEQTRMSQQIAPGGQARGARGSRQNPILINPADPRGSYGNVQVGQVYMLPSGEIREKTR